MSICFWVQNVRSPRKWWHFLYSLILSWLKKNPHLEKGVLHLVITVAVLADSPPQGQVHWLLPLVPPQDRPHHTMFHFRAVQTQEQVGRTPLLLLISAIQLCPILFRSGCLDLYQWFHWCRSEQLHRVAGVYLAIRGQNVPLSRGWPPTASYTARLGCKALRIGP